MGYVIEKEYRENVFEPTTVFEGIAYYPCSPKIGEPRSLPTVYDDLDDAKAIMLATANHFQGIKVRIIEHDDIGETDTESPEDMEKLRTRMSAPAKVIAEKLVKINHLKEVKTHEGGKESRDNGGGRNVASLKPTSSRKPPGTNRQGRVDHPTSRSKRKADARPKKD